jgi:putative transposase
MVGAFTKQFIRHCIGLNPEVQASDCIWLGENESAPVLIGVLIDLRTRGDGDILITSIDNLKWFTEFITCIFL